MPGAPMTAYTFETLTPEQALAFGPGDTLAFTAPGARAALVQVAFTPAGVVVTLAGLSRTFSTALSQASFPDGSRLWIGGAGADTLAGGAAGETLAGGAGEDLISGGLGADVFVFATGSSSAIARDIISDFVAGTDRISFGLGAANSGTGPAGFSAAADAASFTAAQAAAAALISAGTDDVVAVRDTGASLTYVFADTDGDNAIDTVVELTGLVTLAQTDFAG